jgi:hypothetical protein
LVSCCRPAFWLERRLSCSSSLVGLRPRELSHSLVTDMLLLEHSLVPPADVSGSYARAEIPDPSPRCPLPELIRRTIISYTFALQRSDADDGREPVLLPQMGRSDTVIRADAASVKSKGAPQVVFKKAIKGVRSAAATTATALGTHSHSSQPPEPQDLR